MNRRSFLRGALLAVGMAGINLGMLTRKEPHEPIDRDFNFVYQRIYASDIGHYIAFDTECGDILISSGHGNWIKPD